MSPRSDSIDFRPELDELCLFLDADGTLLDITSTPDGVHAPQFLLSVLSELHSKTGGALAIVSGRRVDDLDRIFAPLRLPASGIHGAQVRRTPDGPILDAAVPDIPEAAACAIREVTARHPGAFVEDKGKAMAVHWRAAQHLEAALWADLSATLERVSPALSVLHGHCVFEVKSSSLSKGDAVRAFMACAPFAGRTPVFIGDDVTDIAGMAAVKSFGGHAFSVDKRLEGADDVFPSPSDVRAWLARLAGANLEALRA